MDTFYSYAYQLDISTGRAAKFLQYAKPKKGLFVAYITLDANEYNHLKNGAKKLGFTFLRQENVSEGLMLVYLKENETLQFITQVGDYGNKYSIRLRSL